MLFQEPYPNNLPIAPEGSRMINFIVDFIFSNALTLSIINLIIEPSLQAPLSFWVMILIYSCIRFSYYLICEAMLKGTLGQHLTKSKIVTIDKETPRFIQYFLRTISRVITAPGSFISDDLQAFHDKCSNTYVIKKAQENSTDLDML